MRPAVFSLAGGIFLLLVSLSEPALADPCSPEQLSANVALSIGKIHRFFEKSRGAPSFNYDRLDYLLHSFENNATSWAACRPGGPSSQYTLLISRIREFRARVARERSSSPVTGDPNPTEKTIRGLEEILSRFPVGTGRKTAVPSGATGGNSAPSLRNPSPSLPRPFSPGLWRRSLLGGIVIGGVVLLFLLLGRSLRKHDPSGTGPGLEREDVAFLKKAGLRWIDSRSFRSDLLESIRKKIGKNGRIVRLRAQLLRQGKDKRWTVVDEVSDDEGGLLRTFGETPDTLDPTERVEEIPLGEGEIRTHLLLPVVSGEQGESFLVVVDAISAPEIPFEMPDPSGVLSVLRMKELLVQLAIESETRDNVRIGVISLFFDDPGRRNVLDQAGEVAGRARSFIVEEAVRLTWPGMVVFGEPPGFFHLVLYGRSETETGVWIRALSGGLGPDSPEGKGREDSAWFRKVLVVYTRWKDPDPEKIDPFLERVRGNLQKLVSNPSIKTVIDT